MNEDRKRELLKHTNPHTNTHISIVDHHCYAMENIHNLLPRNSETERKREGVEE